MDEPQWADSVRFLLSLDRVPAAQANGRLLADAEAAWRGRVVARTSMHDLLFTLPGQRFPFREHVRVAWADDVFEVRLSAQGGELVTADRCLAASARHVLDAFLSQLVANDES